MIPLYTDEEFALAKGEDKLSVRCQQCGTPFLVAKARIKHARSPNGVSFCSRACFGASLSRLVEIPCDQCGKVILQAPGQIAKYSNHFCSVSCRSKYWRVQGIRPPKIEVPCSQCGKPVLRPSTWNGKKVFCSHACFGASRRNSVQVPCSQCGQIIFRQLWQRTAHPNHLCSTSCWYEFSKTCRTKGTRRSKLEIWLEEQLRLLYPGLEFIFNDREAINSELDIYIPSLKLAFELNGIFHYEPIFGEKLLRENENRDRCKFRRCLEYGIGLCVIDVSAMKNFKPKRAEVYLSIVRRVIDERLSS